MQDRARTAPDTGHGRYGGYGLETADMVRMAVLGSATRGAVTADEVRVAIRTIAGTAWVPVLDLIVAAMHDMIALEQLRLVIPSSENAASKPGTGPRRRPRGAGHSYPDLYRSGPHENGMAEGGGGERVTITPRGRKVLERLSAQPTQAPGTILGQVGLRLKLAFIDLLPPRTRYAALETAIAAHEGELQSRRQHCDACPVRGEFGRLWFDHDCERLHHDIALLRSMASRHDGACRSGRQAGTQLH